MSENENKGGHKRFMLRLPWELDGEVMREAQNHNRSKNRQIVHLLEKYYNVDDVSGGVVGNDLGEQAVLKWFRGLPVKQRQAFLDFLFFHPDE